MGVEPTMADLQSASDQRKGTKPIHLQQYRQQSESKPNNEAPQNDLLSIARKSVLNWRMGIEKLIDATPLDDTYKLDILRSLFEDLQQAERGIERI